MVQLLVLLAPALHGQQVRRVHLCRASLRHRRRIRRAAISQLHNLEWLTIIHMSHVRFWTYFVTKPVCVQFPKRSNTRHRWRYNVVDKCIKDHVHIDEANLQNTLLKSFRSSCNVLQDDAFIAKMGGVFDAPVCGSLLAYSDDAYATCESDAARTDARHRQRSEFAASHRTRHLCHRRRPERQADDG